MMARGSPWWSGVRRIMPGPVPRRLSGRSMDMTPPGVVISVRCGLGSGGGGLLVMSVGGRMVVGVDVDVG